MGKKQHQKDKLYLTTSEWKSIGGHKDDTGTRLQRAQFKRLPINHCSLSFLPFEDPVCARSGEIFELTAIVPYVKKHGKNPCTGKPLTAKDLIHLKFDKGEDGKFRCPVTFRTFTDHSHILAIATTGNVYSYEAIQELNLKRNHLKDLLNDVPFTRADIIDLQDPNHLEKFNMEQFLHVKLDLKTSEEIKKEKEAMKDPKFYIRRMNNACKSVLDQLDKEYVPRQNEVEADQTADEINAAHYSQGKVAAGFTSTVMAPVTSNKAAVLDDDTVRYSRVKKNGFVRLVTNFGPLNLELYCQKAPKACENFITHCTNGYYNNTKFHRLIKNFMLQGGDPTGTGHGGESIWGKPFTDEFVSGFSHDARGVLSMANKGSNTNGSQFFITFRPCKYLDRKHTIFGRLVGGQDTLTTIEKLETEEGTDVPMVNVMIMRAEVFVDPFEEAEKEVQAERAEILKKTSKDAALMASKKEIDSISKPKAVGTGVGKYMKSTASANKRQGQMEDVPLEAAKKKKFARAGLGDFSKW
ncbi:hypothetical protein L3Y34_018112 [Caenorhabditis briggsae]|uniref:RING-type E3 ubiquitin transferase n=1 Tax=Caenorhabditis briggsae TaxID=6238 RepID=A0AAE9DJ95_CAEBR|nr:hypothetical protein L3Y34_018112 [Caenorhabditis briggsae]